MSGGADAKWMPGGGVFGDYKSHAILGRIKNPDQQGYKKILSRKYFRQYQSESLSDYMKNEF